MVPACEVMLTTPRIRELIEKPDQLTELHDAIEQGAAAYGMQSFDQSLMELLNTKQISYEEALLHCTRPEDFRIRYEGISAMDGKQWSQGGDFAKKVDDQWQNVTEIEIIMPTEIKKSRKSGSGDKS
jgi:twitching motility protein PilT